MNDEMALGLIGDALEESCAVKQRIRQDPELVAAIASCANLWIRALRQGNKLLLVGNGGSAADAQHLAAELTGRFKREREGLPAIALTTDSSALTAIGNDYGYEQIFSRQLCALAQKGDVLVAFSTSGNSANVLEAARVARERGVVVVGLTGQAGGALRELCDQCLCVPSDDTAHIQESHITLGHILCGLTERQWAAAGDRSSAVA